MAKSNAIEGMLSSLHALRAAPATEAARTELGKALGSATNLVVARAAGIVGEFSLPGFEADLEQAFERFMAKSGSTDRGCVATTAIAKTLYELGVAAESVFLRGIRHVQKEGSYSGAVDTACELRGFSALGLVRMAYREVMVELVDLLADNEPQARMAAARAIAYSGRPEGVLLLRLKLLAGDKEPAVLEECMSALARLDPRGSVAFLGRFVDAPEEDLRNAARLALGESRQPEALAMLRTCWEQEFDAEARRTLALAIAMLRLPEAIEFLVSLVSREAVATAAAVIEAMQMYRHDDTLRARLEEIVNKRGEAGLRRAFDGAWPRK
ncbi:MAG: HEAT repeat domain-containing protein [Tepidisphaeraceae bacterium]|jgi:HEAT repeat protein